MGKVRLPLKLMKRKGAAIRHRNYYLGGIIMFEKISITLTVLAVLLKIFHLILCSGYKNNLRKMAVKREGQLFKKISKKYTYCLELSKPVENTYAFARAEIEEDLMQRKTIGFFHRTSTFFAVLSTFCVMSCLIFTSIVEANADKYLIPEELVYIQMIGLVSYILIDRAADVKNAVDSFTILMVDYLDNSVAHRYRERERKPAVTIREQTDQLEELRTKEGLKGEQIIEKTEKLEEAEAIAMTQMGEPLKSKVNIREVVNKNVDKTIAEEIINQVLQEYLI